MELYNRPLHTHIHIISIILLLPHLHLKWAIALNSLLHSPIQKHQLPHHHKLLLAITIITLDHHQIWDILMLMGMVTDMLLDNSNQDPPSNLVQEQEAIITIIILHLNTIQQVHIILHQHHRLQVDHSHMLGDLTVPLLLLLLLLVQQRHHLLILAHITNSSRIIIIRGLHHTTIQVVVLCPPLPLQSLILICLALSLNRKITEESMFSL